MQISPRVKEILFWLLIFFLFVLLVVGISKLLGRKNITRPVSKPGNNTSVIQKVSPVVSSSGYGTLMLSAVNNADIVSVAEPVVVRVSSSSTGTPVVGYDIVISYDPSIISYVSTDHPMSASYTSSVRIDNGRLVLSGVNKQDSTPQAMADTVIEAIRFQPLKTGKTILTIAYTPGKTDESNLMSDQSRDILGKVTPLSLIIGKPMTLPLNEARTIDGSQNSLKLDRVTTPSSGCRDCFTSQDLTFFDPVKHSQVTFGFRAGGFAGVMHDEARVGGYIIKLSSSTDKSINVIVAAE